MKQHILLAFLILGLLLISGFNGCAPGQEGKIREFIETHKEEILKELPRCQNFNGSLCSNPNECALPYLETIESYCCPIPCGTCPIDINCSDDDPCTRDYCFFDFDEGKAVCRHQNVHPCANDGICERGETSIPDSPCCPGVTCGETEVAVESSDCPETCDDGNESTADYYNFTAQRCEYAQCG